MSDYSESIDTLRRKPSVSSFLPRLDLYTMEFYFQRYNSEVVKLVEPTLHGDFFTARSDSNIVFGDFLDAGTVRLNAGELSLAKKTFYGQFLNAEVSSSTAISIG